MSGEQVQALADCVLRFRNPRLRMRGFDLMIMKHQSHPAFRALCRRLLNDKHPGIQLQAAIYLGQSGLASDPVEPRLFPILITALESKEKRQPSLDISGYAYQQWPPGTPKPFPFPFPPSVGVVPPDQALLGRITRALDQLERHLTQEQKDRLRRAERTEREQRQAQTLWAVSAALRSCFGSSRQIRSLGRNAGPFATCHLPVLRIVGSPLREDSPRTLRSGIRRHQGSLRGYPPAAQAGDWGRVTLSLATAAL